MRTAATTDRLVVAAARAAGAGVAEGGVTAGAAAQVRRVPLRPSLQESRRPLAWFERMERAASRRVARPVLLALLQKAAVPYGAVAAAGALCAVDGASGGAAGEAGVVAAGRAGRGRRRRCIGDSSAEPVSVGLIFRLLRRRLIGRSGGCRRRLRRCRRRMGMVPVVVGIAGVAAAAGVVCAPTLEAVVANVANATVTAATRLKAVVSINLAPSNGRGTLNLEPGSSRISITAGTAWRFHAQSRIAAQPSRSPRTNVEIPHGTEKQANSRRPSRTTLPDSLTRTIAGRSRAR